jgi:hypothetical protein
MASTLEYTGGNFVLRRTFQDDEAAPQQLVVLRNDTGRPLWVVYRNFCFEGRRSCHQTWEEDVIPPGEERHRIFEFQVGNCEMSRYDSSSGSDDELAVVPASMAGEPESEEDPDFVGQSVRTLEADLEISYRYNIALWHRQPCHHNSWLDAEELDLVYGRLVVPRGTPRNFCIHFNVVNA